MTTIEKEDKLASAKSQGQAQFESIKEMVAELERFRTDDAGGMESSLEDAETRIHEDALSVEIRSGWHIPGADSKQNPEAALPAEYRILLCTGGPAVQIVGELDEYCQPKTAKMQVQDWFQPWTEYRPIILGTEAGETAENVMLTYARCFWFGE